VEEGKDFFRELASGKHPSLIAFSRKLGTYPYENCELFVMRPNGSHQWRITWNEADDDYPAFSSNGRALAFTSNRSSAPWGNHDVFKFTPWGGVKQLTDEAWQFDSSATDWGPGFITAAQLNTLIGGPFDVVRVIALDPWNAWQKFLDTGHLASYDPCISTKGDQLIFSARPSGPGYFGSLELYIWRKGMEKPVQLTDFGEDDDMTKWVYTRHPSIDFEGKRVVFQTTLWDGNWEIGYMRLDIKKPFPYGPEDATRITFNDADDVQPCFSPCGNWMAVSTNRDGNFEIYKIWDPNSPDPVPVKPIIRLTYTDEDESNPDWSPWYL
jgi:Tol biopolymer transport system component